MIKIRNKRIAMLLVLAMLVTMFASVGTASAASNYIDVDSNYTWVSDDKEDQPAGDIRVIANTDFTKLTASDIDTVYVELTFPDTMDLNNVPAPGGTLTWSLEDSDAQTLVYRAAFAATASDARIFDLTGTTIDVDADVTGSISVAARVYGKDGTSTVFDETENNVIAKVTSSDITTSAASAKSVYIGSDQKGAAITVKEVGPDAFTQQYYDTDSWVDDQVKFTILTSGVTWDTSGPDKTVAKGTYCGGNIYDTDNDKVIYFDFNDDDITQTSKLVLTPYFKISPAAPKGDVKVRVSGDGIETAEYVVGTIGTGGVAVTVKNADEDFVYRGQFATFDDVTVTLDAKGSEIDETDWFSITLPTGLKFANVADPVKCDDDKITVEEDLIKSDKTVWFTSEADHEVDKIKLSDFAIVADADAALGDLSITFDGVVTGTYVIGSVKDAFGITTASFNLQSGLTAADGSDIVIKETADGALKASGDGYDDIDEDHDSWNGFGFNTYYGYFDVVLPAGVTVVGTPSVEVTDGDLEIGEVYIGEDFRDIYFEITEPSNIASTITISGLKYTTLNQPVLGELTAQVGGDYNIYSNKALAKLAVGSVAINPTAVYVIGAATYTVNGVSNNVVAPSYVKNDRTYLAIRDITTGIGIDPTNVIWDEANQRVTMIKGDKIVQVTIGSNVMYVNGVAIAMDVAPEMGPTFRSMLPAAFIAQAFGATASWDGLTSTVTIK